MGTTIKDIAEHAGVSIATVSHVINRTRYVSPELVKKVESIIVATGYQEKIKRKPGNFLSGKDSVIAVVVPSTMSALYAQMIKAASGYIREEGYLMAVYFSEDDYEIEQKLLLKLAADKKTAGIILSPCRRKREDYEKVLSNQVPLIFLERKVEGCEDDCVLAENELGLYRAASHLIRSGHEKIALVLGGNVTCTVKERLSGYKRALTEAGVTYREGYVLSLPGEDSKAHTQSIQDFYSDRRPTAFICCGNQLTFCVLRMMQYMGLECPRDLSVIGFGDEEWCELVVPPLTTIKQNTSLMAENAVKKMLAKIRREPDEIRGIRIPLEISVRKSTQMIGKGPFGEKAYSPDDLVLSEEEKQQLLEGDYKVAISFHYSGTAWKSLHEDGIRQTLDKYGITVLSVTDAHFDPYLQVTQLEGIAMQQPDAVIAIPADDSVTAGIFKKLSKKTKLIFLSNVPEGLQNEDYISCVSVNERENGHIAGSLLGNYFAGRKKVKVGFINHGTSFYGTHLRDMVATQTVCEDYSNIEIAAVHKFQNIEDAYEICRNMIQAHPDIEGLYISWDRPALQAIRALEEMDRTDVSIFTFDLDEEISSYLAQGRIVKGMGTQRPYEQGVAVAMATAKALLGETQFKYIGVPPYLVQRDNFLRAWKDIMHEPAPKRLEKFLDDKNLRKN